MLTRCVYIKKLHCTENNWPPFKCKKATLDIRTACKNPANVKSQKNRVLHRKINQPQFKRRQWICPESIPSRLICTQIPYIDEAMILKCEQVVSSNIHCSLYKYRLSFGYHFMICHTNVSSYPKVCPFIFQGTILLHFGSQTLVELHAM